MFTEVFTPDHPPPAPLPGLGPKRPRRVLPDTTAPAFLAQWERLRAEGREQDAREAAARRAAEEATADRERARKLQAGRASLKEHGFATINEFLAALYTTKDPQLSSTVTKLLNRHAVDHLEAMHARSSTVREWVRDKTVSTGLAKPRRGEPVSDAESE